MINVDYEKINLHRCYISASSLLATMIAEYKRPNRETNTTSIRAEGGEQKKNNQARPSNPSQSEAFESTLNYALKKIPNRNLAFCLSLPDGTQ